ncbi:hypothetical protein ACFO7V_09230 [Glutamicibacter bergerei]|uniref:Gram-positive cocci surface proteins LPxTG domain-containing protein n=1 Tax=Glutamicibacter bergerei TaxID=256702 RepID=A0ABV9MM87_9MICC
MNQTPKNHARKARLPLAVIAAGSLALGGITGGTMLTAPAMAAQTAEVSAASPAADVPPVFQYGPFKVGNPGEELISFDYEKSDPENGVIYLTDNAGSASEGDEVSMGASSLPQTGVTFAAKYEDGQFAYNGPRDTPNSYLTWSGMDSGRQVSFGAYIGADSDNYQGGTHYIPANSPTLVADKIEKNSNTPIFPVGTESWTFNIPAGQSWIADSKVTVSYWSDAPDAPDKGFMYYDLNVDSFSDGQLVVSDAVLPKLSEGDGYFVTFRGASEEESASVYMGLYGQLPSPTPEPTTEPTVEPTATPTTEPTADPTTEPTEEPTTEPTEEPTATPTSEPTSEPTTEPTTDPTTEPTVEPTATPTSEPTSEPTTEPTAEPTVEPTATPTSDPTEEPTAEPTTEPTAEPTVEPTATPTSDPTEEPTAEPTTEPTAEPTQEPTSEPSAPTEVPEAQDPESGDQVAPGEENLSHDSDSSAPETGKYVFNTNGDVEDGSVTVTYRTSPDAKPQTVEGSVKDGKLTVQGDKTFTDNVKDFNQLLITVKDAEGKTISALLSGKSVLALQSDIVDNRLGLPLAEAGSKELIFDVPTGFPTLTAENFHFDLKFTDTKGEPATVANVEYTVDGNKLRVSDPRVAKLTAGTYYLTGTQQKEENNAAAIENPAAESVVTVSTWFGLFDPAVEESPVPTDEPTEKPTSEPTEDPTTEPSATVMPTQDAPEQENPKDEESRNKDSNNDELADTGANDGLLIAGSVALGLIILGGIALALRRRGRHS